MIPDDQVKADVCLIYGPGRFECWGCPVRACPFWEDPFNPLSEATIATALKGAKRLVEHRLQVHVAPDATVPGTAWELMFKTQEPEVQEALRVEMAAEAAYHHLLPQARVTQRENQMYDSFLKKRATRSRALTAFEEEEFDRIPGKAEAEIASDTYECQDVHEVEKMIAYLRGTVRG